MSHKSTPYSPNFPPSQGYSPPSEDRKPLEGYPMAPQGGYPGPPVHTSQPMPMAVHGAHHLPNMQPGFQPGFQPGHQPGYQTGYAPGYPHPQAYSAVVVSQPVPGSWMSVPQGLSNCPPGLEYLSMIDQLLVRQKIELLESFIGYETNNKYTVKNSVGQKVYYAVEVNDCCTRNCCGHMRPFDMKIFDNFQNEVIHLRRPLACDSCLCPCWLQSVDVTAPPGNVIGTVEQDWSLCKPYFSVKDATGTVVLRIKGPLCTTSICGQDVKFGVYSSDGETKVGKISKSWSGLAREMFTDADYFGITFPMDLDVKIKAVLLGACFLIDFMFFEKTPNDN